MSLEEFDGTVTVRDAAGKDKTARADMRLYNGYTIATGKASSAYINLGVLYNLAGALLAFPCLDFCHFIHSVK